MMDRVLYRNRLIVAVVLAAIGCVFAVCAVAFDSRMLLFSVLLGGCAYVIARVAAEAASFSADRPLREAAQRLQKMLW